MISSMEKFNQRSCRMFSDFMEINSKIRRRKKHYKYSDANRDHMKAILKNHSDFSVDEKIETLIKFHKDTCANVFLKLYPSTGGGGDARQDLQILKDFERVLVEIQLEYRKTYLEGSYHQFSATLRLLQMKASMLEFLKSPDAASYPEDFKMTLEKLGCVEDYGYIYDNDEERLETFQSEKFTAHADLQKLGVDMSQYQDDSVGYEQYFNGQPTQAEILEHYKLLEKEATRTSDKMDQLREDAQPTNRYLQDIERHIVFMEMALTTASCNRNSKFQEKTKNEIKNTQENTMQGNQRGRKDFASWKANMIDVRTLIAGISVHSWKVFWKTIFSYIPFKL